MPYATHTTKIPLRRTSERVVRRKQVCVSLAAMRDRPRCSAVWQRCRRRLSGVNGVNGGLRGCVVYITVGEQGTHGPGGLDANVQYTGILGSDLYQRGSSADLHAATLDCKSRVKAAIAQAPDNLAPGRLRIHVILLRYLLLPMSLLTSPRPPAFLQQYSCYTHHLSPPHLAHHRRCPHLRRRSHSLVRFRCFGRAQSTHPHSASRTPLGCLIPIPTPRTTRHDFEPTGQCHGPAWRGALTAHSFALLLVSQ